jgi:hypothetical protein
MKATDISDTRNAHVMCMGMKLYFYCCFVSFKLYGEDERLLTIRLTPSAACEADQSPLYCQSIQGIELYLLSPYMSLWTDGL